ncbi:Defect at low temperature protein 1 [Spathaspora sp. JA1]|nr:Defect at low temperature protein 1 [Spathaspora sp. JA1]
MQRRSSFYMNDPLTRQPQSIASSVISVGAGAGAGVPADAAVTGLVYDNISLHSITPGISPRPSIVSRVQTAYTNNDQYRRRRILSWPQKIFRWLYSFSLIIFILLFLAFVAVTPLDVIAQTFDTNNSIAVKTFIVIIVCVVFIILSLVVYFTRLFNYRVSMNDIPTRSLYIPDQQGDYPVDVSTHIDTKLTQSVVEIREKAGPLANKSIIVINHPGVSPPDYIQRHNQRIGTSTSSQAGTLLPPNVHYEDIVRSLGDKFYLGKILTEDDLPIHLSLREIMLYLAESFLENNNNQGMPDLTKLTKLYEKFRFGPDLICELDLFEFMIEFDKFGTMCQNDYQNKLPKNQSRRMSRFSNGQDQQTEEYNSNWDYSSGIFYDSSFEVESLPQFQHKMVENKYFTNVDSPASDDQISPQGSIKRTVSRKTSGSSSRSVIRNRLALASRHTLSNITKNIAPEMSSLKRETSGYMTDSESEGYQANNEETEIYNDTTSPLSAIDFYGFRRRRSTFVAPDVIQDYDLNISNEEIKNIDFNSQRQL